MEGLRQSLLENYHSDLPSIANRKRQKVVLPKISSLKGANFSKENNRIDIGGEL